ncbi:MAG: methyltransferase domain-containing protein [Burkholderiales bacterium]|nr:methyltransferase domain-containing protein [Burkholderiales bacterium]
MKQGTGTSAPPSGFEARWRERFQRFGAAHDDDAGIAGWSTSGLGARYRNFCLVWPGGRKGSVWIDAGCGAGTYARRLEQDQLTVVGLDYSLPTLRKARERSPSIHAWSVGDVTRLPLRSVSADGLLCFGVMQALGSAEAATREMARVLKPGGEVWVDALNAACIPDGLRLAWRRLRKLPPHLRYDDPADLAATLRRSGFDDVRVHWVPIMPGKLRGLQSAVECAPVRSLLRALPFLGRWLSHAFVLQARRTDKPGDSGG